MWKSLWICALVLISPNGTTQMLCEIQAQMERELKSLCDIVQVEINANCALVFPNNLTTIKGKSGSQRLLNCLLLFVPSSKRLYVSFCFTLNFRHGPVVSCSAAMWFESSVCWKTHISWWAWIPMCEALFWWRSCGCSMTYFHSLVYLWRHVKPPFRTGKPFCCATVIMSEN